MSQYPLPYMPPNVTPQYGVPPNMLAPAKRASIMMFILGPLLVVFGGCLLSIPAILKVLTPEQVKPLMDQMQNSHIPQEMIVPVVIASGVLVLLPGIALIVLGLFVRRGGSISAILGAIMVGLILLYNGVSLVVALLHAGDANGAASACVDVVTLGIFGTLFVWLVQAIRAASAIKLAQQHYQAQYWQYQQHMQAYMGHQQSTPGYPQQTQGYAQAPQQQFQPPPPLQQQPPVDPNAPPQG